MQYGDNQHITRKQGLGCSLRHRLVQYPVRSAILTHSYRHTFLSRTKFSNVTAGRSCPHGGRDDGGPRLRRSSLRRSQHVRIRSAGLVGNAARKSGVDVGAAGTVLAAPRGQRPPPLATPAVAQRFGTELLEKSRSCRSLAKCGNDPRHTFVCVNSVRSSRSEHLRNFG